MCFGSCVWERKKRVGSLKTIQLLYCTFISPFKMKKCATWLLFLSPYPGLSAWMIFVWPFGTFIMSLIFFFLEKTQDFTHDFDWNEIQLQYFLFCNSIIPFCSYIHVFRNFSTSRTLTQSLFNGAACSTTHVASLSFSSFYACLSLVQFLLWDTLWTYGRACLMAVKNKPFQITSWILCHIKKHQIRLLCEQNCHRFDLQRLIK